MTDRHQTRKVIRVTLITIFLLFLFGYTFFEIQKMVFGPKIVVLSPKNGGLVSQSLIEISGKTANIKSISLNDKSIFIDEKGNFSEKILLSYGYNVLTLKASDKFGRETEKTVEVVYK